MQKGVLIHFKVKAKSLQNLPNCTTDLITINFLYFRHLTKLYDSLGKLKMHTGTKNARGMWAKDGEYVEFKGVCDCSGKSTVKRINKTKIIVNTL